jgi:K(+)-stimulated pyrophosphate-energized sodium pump
VAYLVSIGVLGLPGDLHGERRRDLGQYEQAGLDLKEKNTPAHAATVVGDTVGGPFKDTTSVALSPIIKFSTLFGLLAVEIAVVIRQSAHQRQGSDCGPIVGVVMLAVGLVFVWRSFYAMRIPPNEAAGGPH